MIRFFGAVRAALTCAAAGFLFATRAGWFGGSSRVLALVAGAALLASAVHLVLGLSALRRRERVVSLAASLAFSAGVVLVGAGGLANWLRSVQGYVILSERETRALGAPGGVDALEVGPLASSSDLGVTLTLERVELEAASSDAFRPVAHLRVSRPGDADQDVVLDAGRSAATRALRLHLGAFGFTPRIVVIKSGRPIFDQPVPFRSQPDSGGLRFEETIELQAEKLAVSGVVTLEGLDERMKGHPRLSLSVTQEGKPIGEGILDPGHFATIERGYRVGFVGMTRWAEVDVTRRTYPTPIMAGLALMVLGLVAWPIAVWRRW